MNSFLEELIKLLGGFAIFAAALAWLIKSLTTHLLQKDIEIYKSRIASELAKELEGFKSQLQIAAKEHDIRFNKLHERRIEILSELYSRLEQASALTNVFKHAVENKDSFGIDDEKLEGISEPIFSYCRELTSFFNKHRLYLSKELSDHISDLIFIIQRPSSAYSIFSATPEKADIRSNILEKWNKDRKKIPEIMRIIEREFRAMIGSEKLESLKTGGEDGENAI